MAVKNHTWQRCIDIFLDMEDAHTHLLSIPEDKDASFFGVYDGHGGRVFRRRINVVVHFNNVHCIFLSVQEQK